MTASENIKPPLRFAVAGKGNLQAAADISYQTYCLFQPTTERELRSVIKRSTEDAVLMVKQKAGSFFTVIILPIIIRVIAMFVAWLIERWWKMRSEVPAPAAPVIQ